jgi:hypothetical protein
MQRHWMILTKAIAIQVIAEPRRQQVGGNVINSGPIAVPTF